MTRAWLAVVCGVVASSSLPARSLAQGYETPRLLSLAGAGMALASGNDAFYANPAAIALGNFYSVELGYQDDFEGGDRRISSSITDGHDKRLTGGVGYVYRDRLTDERAESPDLRTTIHRFDVALAGQLTKGFAIGVQGRYVTTTDDIDGEDIDDSGFSQFTFDASAVIRMESGLSLAFVGTNLTNSDRPELPIGLGGALGFGHEMFGLEFDVRYDFKTEKPWLGGSASILLGKSFAIRGGGAYDFATESAAVSFGLGFQSSQFAADLGFRQKVGGPSGAPAPGLDTERIFALAIRGVPFQ